MKAQKGKKDRWDKKCCWNDLTWEGEKEENGNLGVLFFFFLLEKNEPSWQWKEYLCYMLSGGVFKVTYFWLLSFICVFCLSLDQCIQTSFGSFVAILEFSLCPSKFGTKIPICSLLVFCRSLSLTNYVVQCPLVFFFLLIQVQTIVIMFPNYTTMEFPLFFFFFFNLHFLYSFHRNTFSNTTLNLLTSTMYWKTLNELIIIQNNFCVCSSEFLYSRDLLKSLRHVWD